MTFLRQSRRTNTFLTAALLLGISLSIVRIVSATTPNPGHPWTEVGDGVFAVSGPSVLRTFAFPDASATVLTSNAAVTVAQGGTGAATLTGVLIGNGTSAVTATSVLTAANGGTGNGFTTFSGPTTSTKTFTLPDASATVLTSNAAVTVAQGGTGAATLTGVLIGNGTSAVTGTSVLTATNGGTGNGFTAFTGPTTSTKTFTLPDASATILTSNAAVTVAQGGTGLATLTANNVMLGNGTSSPTFVAPGTSGNVLISDGTTWSSAAQPSQSSVVVRPYMATGATAAVASTSLTAYKVGLFNVPEAVTINQLAYNVGTVTTAGTFRFCIYNEAGSSKLVDVTDVPTAGVNTVAVSSVKLDPGNYYIAFGCGTTCSNTVTTFTSTATSWINGAGVPSGKKVHEGTVTMTSGTCNSTLPTITGGNSVVPVVRLDN